MYLPFFEFVGSDLNSELVSVNTSWHFCKWDEFFEITDSLRGWNFDLGQNFTAWPDFPQFLQINQGQFLVSWSALNNWQR